MRSHPSVILVSTHSSGSITVHVEHAQKREKMKMDAKEQGLSSQGSNIALEQQKPSGLEV